MWLIGDGKGSAVQVWDHMGVTGQGSDLAVGSFMLTAGGEQSSQKI